MRIIDLLHEERVKVYLEQSGKDKILEELVELATRGRPDTQRSSALKAVYEREAVASTGIGLGVAIPHAKIPWGEELIVAFGLTRAPVNFDAIDGQPAQLFFLVLCPLGEAGLQLRFLARLSRLLHDATLREQLLACTTPAQVLEALRAYESRHFG